MENGTEKRRKGLAAAVAALVMVVIFGLILFSLLAALGRQWGSEFIWLPFSWWSMPWQSWP